MEFIPDLIALEKQSVIILTNQVGYNLDDPKITMVISNQALMSGTTFQIINVQTNL